MKPHRGEGLTLEKRLELLLYDLRRYQAAVARVSENNVTKD
jgi:hypothetical protein